MKRRTTDADVPPVTKEQAIAAGTWPHSGEFFSPCYVDSRGYPVRIRATGKCQTWKTRPAEFKLPVKWGMYDSFYLTEKNAGEWSAVEPEPELKPTRKTATAGAK